MTPQLAEAVRRSAAQRDVSRWRALEDALTAGLPTLQPVGEPLPHVAYDHTRRRGQATVGIYAEISIAVADDIRAAAAERHAHVWWVVEEALRLGLPLLPPPTRVPVLDYDEELRQSA